MTEQPLGEVPGVLRNRSFLYLWVAQALSQTALNAIIYALLIRVEEGTGSSTALGLLILSFVVPSVVFGVAAGVFVDRWHKKTVLLTTNLLRALIVCTFLVLAQNFWLILFVNLMFSIVSQFFAPAELAAIPAVVPKHQLILANGLFNLTMSGAQLLGFVLVGPLLVKSLVGPTVFVAFALVYAVCALLIWLMQLEEPEIRRNDVDLKLGWSAEVVREIREGWRLLVKDNAVSLSILHLTLVNSLVLVIGMLAPGYVSRVLGIRADDSVYVMAPAGIGMLAGIAMLPRLAQRWAKDFIANLGIFLTAGILYLLGLVGRMGSTLMPKGLFQRLGLVVLPEEAGLVGLVMALALILGFGYALVNVSAQTLVQERVPFDLRGRVFATQFAFANAAAVLPLLFLGGLADLVGITEVTLLCATVVLIVGIFSTLQARRERSLGWEQN